MKTRHNSRTFLGVVLRRDLGNKPVYRLRDQERGIPLRRALNLARFQNSILNWAWVRYRAI